MRRTMILGSAAAALVALSSAACGNDVEQPTGGAGGATASSSSATNATATSVASTTATQSSVSSSTGMTPTCLTPDGAILAIDQLFLGDTNPDGTKSPTAWKQYGANIDGLVTTNDFSMHCTPNSNASAATVFPDGDNGNDNSFGKNIVPIFNAFAQNFSDTVNATFAAGDGALIFDLTGLGSGADQTGVDTRFYAGDPLGHPAAFDGTDCWPVDAAGLETPTDITSAKTVFVGGAIAGNVFTSGAPTTLSVTIPVQGFPVTLVVHQATVTATLSADHQTMTGGQVSGVIDTEEFVATVKTLAGSFDPSLCSGAVLNSILTQIRQASDILNDGTQSPASMCNGISIGLGFTAKPIQLGGIGPASQPPPNPCP